MCFSCHFDSMDLHYIYTGIIIYYNFNDIDCETTIVNKLYISPMHWHASHSVYYYWLIWAYKLDSKLPTWNDWFVQNPKWLCAVIANDWLIPEQFLTEIGAWMHFIRRNFDRIDLNLGFYRSLIPVFGFYLLSSNMCTDYYSYKSNFSWCCSCSISHQKIRIVHFVLNYVLLYLIISQSVSISSKMHAFDDN